MGSDDEDGSGLIEGTETATAGVSGQTTTALKEPTGSDYTGIFGDWDVSVPSARELDSWDFGEATDYPVLRRPGAPPAFPAGTAMFSIAEEGSAGAMIGSPLIATGGRGQALTYKLVGAGAVFFSIGNMTGQLSAKTSLDYETPGDADRDNTYEFMVQASDGTTVAFRNVAVTVSDVIENLLPPTITGSDGRHRRGEQHRGRHLPGGGPRRRDDHLHMVTRRDRCRGIRASATPASSPSTPLLTSRPRPTRARTTSTR